MDANSLEAITQKQMSLIVKLQNRLETESWDSSDYVRVISALLIEAVHVLTALHALDVASEGRSPILSEGGKSSSLVNSLRAAR
jgi:hypothetical protein